MKKTLLTITTLLISSALSLAIADTAGTVTHLSGTLTVQKPDGAQKILAVKSQVESGDTLITAPEAFARIKFVDKSEIVLRPETTFQISDYKFNPDKPEENKSFSNLVKGGMRSVTGLIGQQDKEKVKFETPTATIGIRGTHFGLLNCAGNCASVPTVTGNPPPDGLHVDVSQGGVSVTNAAGTLNLNPGEFGFVQSPNTPPVQVPPNQGIQVSMPSNISQNDAGGKGGVGGSKSGGCTVQ